MKTINVTMKDGRQLMDLTVVDVSTVNEEVQFYCEEKGDEGVWLERIFWLKDVRVMKVN